MNTRPTKKGEGEREGRFQFAGREKRTECGMHEHRAKWKAKQEEAEKQKKPFNIPSLPCPDVLQLHPETFEPMVLNTRAAVLVEFYSPLCGHCQHFGPTYAKVVQRLKGSNHIAAARYDLFNYTVPEVAKKAGIEVGGYPSLWLVRSGGATGKPVIREYEGEQDAGKLIRWVKEQLDGLIDDL